MGIKPKQIKFLVEYISNGFNATQAYLDTIARKNTTYYAAQAESSRTLLKPIIKEAFNIWKERFLESIKGQLEPQIIRQLMVRAFYDPNDYLDDKGEIIPLSKLTKEQRQVIDNIEVKYHGKDAIKQISYKLADRDKARQELEKYKGIMEESLKIDIVTKRNEKAEELLENAIDNFIENKQSKTN